MGPSPGKPSVELKILSETKCIKVGCVKMSMIRLGHVLTAHGGAIFAGWRSIWKSLSVAMRRASLGCCTSCLSQSLKEVFDMILQNATASSEHWKRSSCKTMSEEESRNHLVCWCARWKNRHRNPKNPKDVWFQWFAILDWQVGPSISKTCNARTLS